MISHPPNSRATRPWPSRLRHRWRRVARGIAAHDVEGGWLIIAFAALIGAGSGYAIILFYDLIELVGRLGERVAAAVNLAPGSAAALFLVIPLGLLVARWLVTLDRGTVQGAMVPDLIFSIAKRGGDLPVVGTLAKVLAAAVTLGSGGSLGPEGPVAAAGAAIGSGLGKMFEFRPRRLKILLGCGVAAGISAAFNAPIAGVLFALEIVLGTFTVSALSPVVVASVMGAAVSRWRLGTHPAFDVPTHFLFVSTRELGFYLVLGLACGLLAALFVRGFYATQDLLRRVVGQGWLAPIVGGLLLAAIGMAYPQLLGEGNKGIQLALFGKLTWFTALSIALLKIVASGITMGARGTGGVFTPCMFVGAAFGSFFGLTLHRLFPGVAVTPEAYALVGMGAVVAGATFAPLTAMILILEMTDNYGLTLPLMLVCVISYVVARRLSAESIYTDHLARSGHRIRHGTDHSILEEVRVAECYERNPDVILQDAPLRDIFSRLEGSRQTEFPVIDRELNLTGMLSYQELSRAIGKEGLLDLVLAADLAQEVNTAVCPDDTLLDATRKMSHLALDFIPVVESAESRKLVGLLRRADILEAYQTHLLLHP